MSIRILSHVWETSLREGGELLVELALADACNDDGECWIKHCTLAKKVRLGERQTRKIVAKFIADGIIDKKSSPSHDRNCNTYVFMEWSPKTMVIQDQLDWSSSSSPSIDEPSDEPSIQAEVIEATEPTKKYKPSPAIFNAIKDLLFSLEHIPFTERRGEDHSRIGRAIKSMFASTPNLTVEEVKNRADNYNKKYPGTFTSNALAKWWSTLGSGITSIKSTSDGIINHSRFSD